MKYLDGIALINFALETLKKNQRVQVPTSKVQELTTVLISLDKRIGNDKTMLYETTRDDLLQAFSVVQDMSGAKYLSDKIKQTLVDGFIVLKSEICKVAYEYYESHDFEPDETNIPLMRDVVKTYMGGEEDC